MKSSILLFGGKSEERLVSVASAQNMARQFDFAEIWFLHKNGSLARVEKAELLAHQKIFEVEFETFEEPFAKSVSEALPRLKDSSVFLALHGTEGEDGTLQKILEDAKVAFTGSGSVSSRNAFLKDISKSIVTKKGVPVAPQMMVNHSNANELKSSITRFYQEHKKIVLKPLANGSSIGLHIIQDTESLERALNALASNPYGDYLAEKFLEGRELTVGILQSETGLVALPPSEVILSKGHSFDYHGKYLGRGTTEITPAELSPSEVAAVQALAKTAHQALQCYGYSRTDIILTPMGPVFLETNTLPGLSKASFVPQQLAAAGISFQNFIEMQLKLAEARA